MPKSTSCNTAADGRTQLTFTPEPEIAERLEKLRSITNLDLDELLNTLLAPPLEQIIGLGDTGYLQSCIAPYEYDDKRDALVVIDGYNRFITELQANGNHCDHDLAAAMRTRDGQWRVAFKATYRPDFGDCEGPIYR